VDDQLAPDTPIPTEPTTVPEVPVVPSVAAEVPEMPKEPEAVAEEKKARTGGKWTLALGALVIVAGLVYLLYELNWFSGQKDISHWWGFLILIPAVISFVIAWWVSVKKAGHLGWPVLRWLVIGVALVALALVFAFKSNLNEVWPVLTVIVGVAIALSWKG
jgi:hypothetical protein